MKKILLAILTATLTLSIFCFAGCKQLSTGELPPCTHISGDWIIDEQPSCEKTGLKHKECTVCKETLQNDTIDALTHEYENNICKRCGGECLRFKLLQDKTEYEVVGMEDATLTNIQVPSTYKDLPVTSIGKHAFWGLSNLESITIPDSVTSIGKHAFWDCSSLKSITIPDGVTSIGDNTFRNCSSLTSITIPESVTYIDTSAFRNCSSLSVYYKGAQEQWTNISISSGNECFIFATRYYYSETKPTTSGNYWHYVDNTPTIWE